MKIGTESDITGRIEFGLYSLCEKYLMHFTVMPAMRYKLFLTFVIVFFLSLCLPVLGSTTHFGSSTIMAYLDVSMAFFLVVLVTILYLTRKPMKKGVRRKIIGAYKVLMSVPVCMLILYVLPFNIQWDILLVGVSWRIWLLALILDELVSIYLRTQYRRQRSMLSA